MLNIQVSQNVIFVEKSVNFVKCGFYIGFLYIIRMFIIGKLGAEGDPLWEIKRKIWTSLNKTTQR